MNSLLKHDREHIASILEKVQSLAQQYFNKQNYSIPSLTIERDQLKVLPKQGIGAMDVLSIFEQHYAQRMANSAGPRYFGFVTGGSTPAAIAGDWLVSVYDQVMSGSNDTIAHQLEQQALDFLKQLFNLDRAYTGSFVTGATMSNFVGLATARQWVGEQLGVDISEEGLYENARMCVLSGTPHSSVLKSMSMLGMGRKSMIKIATQPEREAVDIIELEKIVKVQRQPVIVVANAGTVNTVDFDDLEAIGELKQRYNFWLHVDAAFGGFASCSPKFSHFMYGINAADSITIDAHKWLNVPYDAAMHFTKHPTQQLRVFQNHAAYLGDPSKRPDALHYTPENSRRFRALPSWFSLMAYGSEGYREIVERNCASAQRLGNLISQTDEFKLLAPVRMNVVCFTINSDSLSMETIQQFLDAVRDDGRVFMTPTLYKGVPAIRAAISNWQTTDDDVRLAFEVLREVSDKFFDTLKK